MTSLVLSCALAVLAYMTALFLIALVRRDNSLADTGWGLGFILVAVLSFVRQPAPGARTFLVDGLILLWGLRLAVHIFTRSRKRGEDFRYAKWRTEWGRWFVLRSYLQVFILQGTILLVVAVPIMLVNFGPGPRLNALDFAGAAVWLLGFVFETVGDAELLRFKRDPANRGRIMSTGLWGLTRHPNYFGESSMWWGISLIALSAPNGGLGLVSPALLTFMLLRVSGVAMLEKKYEGRPDFAAYARRTSAFIPWFPRRTEAATSSDPTYRPGSGRP
jgi:steroid 5-alpha reductase family enzyme